MTVAPLLDGGAPDFGRARRGRARPGPSRPRARPRHARPRQSRHAAALRRARRVSRPNRVRRRCARDRSPPMRSPAGVTATRPGCASTRSSAVRQPSTSTVCASNAARTACSPGTCEWTCSMNGRAPGGTSADCDGVDPVGVGDEQERVRVAVLELLDRAPQRITPLDHDGPHRVPERRRRRRDLGAGLDLQMVDERPDHTGDAFELERARGGTRRAQAAPRARRPGPASVRPPSPSRASARPRRATPPRP